MPYYFTPLSNSGDVQRNVTFNATINLSVNSDGSNVVLTNTSTFTTDNRGLAFLDINISSFSQIPNYIVENINGTVRTTHLTNDMVFRNLYVKRSNTTTAQSINTSVDDTLTLTQMMLGSILFTTTNGQITQNNAALRWNDTTTLLFANQGNFTNLSVKEKLYLNNFTNMSIVIIGENGLALQDQNFTWDSVNKRLGIGLVPQHTIDIAGLTMMFRDTSLNQAFYFDTALPSTFTIGALGTNTGRIKGGFDLGLFGQYGGKVVLTVGDAGTPYTSRPGAWLVENGSNGPRFGVGVYEPSARLDVNGTLNTSGVTMLNGTNFVVNDSGSYSVGKLVCLQDGTNCLTSSSTTNTTLANASSPYLINVTNGDLITMTLAETPLNATIINLRNNSNRFDKLTDYPTGCTPTDVVQTVGSTLTCVHQRGNTTAEIQAAAGVGWNWGLNTSNEYLANTTSGIWFNNTFVNTTIVNLRNNTPRFDKLTDYPTSCTAPQVVQGFTSALSCVSQRGNTSAEIQAAIGGTGWSINDPAFYLTNISGGFTFNQSINNQTIYNLTNPVYVRRDTWTTIDNYPAGCSAGQFVSAIGDTLTCTIPSGGGAGWMLNQTGLLNDSAGKIGLNVTFVKTLDTYNTTAQMQAAPTFFNTSQNSVTSADQNFSLNVNTQLNFEDSKGNQIMQLDEGSRETRIKNNWSHWKNTSIAVLGSEFLPNTLNVGGVADPTLYGTIINGVRSIGLGSGEVNYTLYVPIPYLEMGSGVRIQRVTFNYALSGSGSILNSVRFFLLYPGNASIYNLDYNYTGKTTGSNYTKSFDYFISNDVIEPALGIEVALQCPGICLTPNADLRGASAVFNTR